MLLGFAIVAQNAGAIIKRHKLRLENVTSTSDGLWYFLVLQLQAQDLQPIKTSTTT